MRVLYFDCGMGAAGDMLSAALYELLDEEDKRSFIDKMNSLGISDVVVSAEKTGKCGICGTHIRVSVGGVEEDEAIAGHEHNKGHEHEHKHEHEHGHHGEHHHSSMADIISIIDSMPLSREVRNNAVEVYKLIAEAESRAHGADIKDIHFHEVGTGDAIADITAVCLLMEKLAVEKVVCSPVHVGKGHVHCAHGILPVPAPATAYILKDVPIYSRDIEGELCTPTGAALLKHFVSSFGEMPVMSVERVGYGMGKRDFTAVNCVRAMLGETQEDSESVIELTCNIDDMTPERVGFAMEHLFELGALEAYTVPVGMKKSRPGIMLCVICREEKRDEMINSIFRHTTTIGIRENISARYTLKRRIESTETVFGTMRIKYSEGYGVRRKKYEYDDIAAAARKKGISMDEVMDMIEHGESAVPESVKEV